MSKNPVYAATALSTLLMAGGLPAANATTTDPEPSEPVGSVTSTSTVEPTTQEPAHGAEDDHSDHDDGGDESKDDNGHDDEPVEFKDVPEGLQFREDILWMAEHEIAEGWRDSTFRPFLPVNRDTMAAFLYRISGSPDYDAPDESLFTNVSTKQLHYKEMAWLHDQKIAEGWDNGDGTASYRPLQPVNRDAVGAFLYRLAGEPEVDLPDEPPFNDVRPGQKHYEAVVWIKQAGIATGWNNGNYGPVQSIKRDAMAAFLHRYHAKVQEPDGA